MAAATRQKSGWVTANVVIMPAGADSRVWIFALSFKDPSSITDPTYFADEVDLGELQGDLQLLGVHPAAAQLGRRSA